MTPQTPTQGPLPFRKGVKGAAEGVVGVLALILLLVVAAAVVVVAWRSMNLGTFVLFALLVSWVLFQSWSFWKAAVPAIQLLELRIKELERRAGLTEAWAQELQDAAGWKKKTFGGRWYEHVDWPWDEEKLGEFRWERWHEWKAKYDAVINEKPRGVPFYKKEYIDWESEKYRPVMWERPSWVPADYDKLVSPHDADADP